MSLAETMPTIEPWPPIVEPDDLASLNALFRRRGAVEFFVGGRPARFELKPNEDPGVIDGPAFRVAIAGLPLVVRMPSALATDLVRTAGARRSLDRLDPDAAALVLEYALSSDIERLERALGGDVAILARTDATFLLRGREVAAELNLDGRSHELKLWLDRDAMARLGAALDRLSPAPDPLDVAQTVRVCMGFREVPLSGLRDLARGDVVVLESGRGLSGPVAVVGNRLAARLTADGGKLAAATRFAPLAGTHWEWTMDQTVEPKRLESLEEAEIEALPVKLVFELGRTDMSVGEVKRVGAGTVIPLSRALDEAVDIVANGRRIGQGSIVRIGDAIGVRVERLNANG